MKRLLPILISFILCAVSAGAQDMDSIPENRGVLLIGTEVEPAEPRQTEQQLADSQQAIRQYIEQQAPQAPATVTQGGAVTVSGVMTSYDSGDPLIGATVLAGPSNAVITSATGHYSIKAAVGTRLAFQYMGYLTYWWTIPSGAETQTHDVQLESDLQVMDDVVVVAYGVRQKGTVAGSVSTISAGQLEDTSTASFDQALQGKTTGLTVMATSGEPSQPAKFSIRGTNSINSGTDPLFIMDGIPISSADFNAISPSDIESISVLKDASSTSIYGARAANGVIIITTKRGSAAEGKAKITLRTQLGFSQLASGKWNLMNTAERIQYEKEVGLTAGQNYDRLSKIDINWRDEIFSNFAPLQNYELQISGATDRVNYFVSGGYYTQDGMTSDSDFSRINFRANVEARANNWLKLGTNTILAYETYSRSESGAYYLNTPISASRFMLPYLDPYKSNGSLASINDGSWKGSGENPLEWVVNNPAGTKKYKAISSVFLEIQPVNGLTIRSQGSIDYSHIFSSSRSMASYAPNNGEGRASKSTSDTRTLTITNTVNYRFDVQRAHRFNFMVGQEGIDFYGESFAASVIGAKNDQLTNFANATRATNWGDANTSYAFVSVFGRGEYNYKSRYYADLSIRGDWSSRFGKNRRGAAFWSLGLMWNVLGENFISNNTKKWLTTAQVTFSTGTSGNSEIPHYDHLALVSGGLDYMGEAGLAPVSKGNPNLSWEQLWSTNVGLRLGFWNRVGLDIEFYNKLTTKMLMEVPVSYSDAGMGSRWDNIGAMVNRGVEINLSADLVSTKSGFVWSVNGNASYNMNKITELYGGVTEYVLGSTKLQVGHPYGEFYINSYAGVNPANGDALWYDKNGNITNEFNEDDKVLVGKSFIAPWQGGFGTTLSWKGISFTAQFSWVAQRYMMNNDRYFEEGNGIFDAYNQSKRLLYDRWKKPGDVTDIPRHGISPQFDTHLLEDASFLRLKNVMLSYSFPRALLQKTKFFSGLRIYVQGNNLLTFTKFTGLDPESVAAVYAAEYPAARQFSFGIDVTF